MYLKFKNRRYLSKLCTLKIKFSTKIYNRFCKKRGYKKIDLKNPEIDYSMSIYKDNNVDVKPKVVFEDTLMTLSSFVYKNLKYPEGTFTGITHSEETKLKMSESSKGKSKGVKNSQFGTCWITKDSTSRKVTKEDIQRQWPCFRIAF